MLEKKYEKASCKLGHLSYTFWRKSKVRSGGRHTREHPHLIILTLAISLTGVLSSQTATWLTSSPPSSLNSLLRLSLTVNHLPTKSLSLFSCIIFVFNISCQGLEGTRNRLPLTSRWMVPPGVLQKCSVWLIHDIRKIKNITQYHW